MVQVTPELARGDALLQLRVGGGDDPNVGALAPSGRPDSSHLVPVERAKELGLRLERQIADLVEKERASLGFGEGAIATGMGPGERAAFVSEQLALDELARQCRHVDRDERPCSARPFEVERAGDELLARSALS
jgi:hypothetical protein